MSETDPMPTIEARRNPRISSAERMLSEYAKHTEVEQVLTDYHEANACRRLEGGLADGINLFVVIQDIERGCQAGDLRGDPEMIEAMPLIPRLYKGWLSVAGQLLDSAKGFVRKGYRVDGVDDLEMAIEEVRAILGNIEIAETLIPLAERLEMGHRGNPDPERYGN